MFWVLFLPYYAILARDSFQNRCKGRIIFSYMANNSIIILRFLLKEYKNVFFSML